jgi:hypothetical protein
MPNAKISELTAATALDGTELIAVVQSSTTVQTSVKDIKNYLISTNITVSATQIIDLGDGAYDEATMIHLTWSGGIGNMTLTLPSVNGGNTNRTIRFISDSSFATNTRVYLTPAGSDTIDGSTDYYEINKAYEGIALWSDGSEWFIIQKKA